jgi:septal ring-binding cell division protein DamX
MPATQTRETPAPATACPTCGAPAERGQLICLECGSRIALAYRRPPSWKVPAAIVTLVVLVAAAGFVLALRALTDDAENEVASQPAPAAGEDRGGGTGSDARERDNGDDRAGAGEQRNETEKDRAADDEKPADERGQDESAAEDEPAEDEGETSGGLTVGPGGVRAWPERADGFTVVILSSEDRVSARTFAEEANNAGIKAGVLRADDYPALRASTGFFIVFVGRYANQAGADRAAARLSRRYSGAYPQFVDGSKRKR